MKTTAAWTLDDRELGIIDVYPHVRARRITFRTKEGGVRATVPPGVTPGEVRKAVDELRPRLLLLLRKSPRTVIDWDYRLDGELFSLRLLPGEDGRFLSRNLDGEVPFSTLYLVGEAAPSAIKLEQSSDDSFIFTYNGALSAGNMLISSTTATSGCAGYQPLDNNGLGTTTIQLVDDIGTASKQWNIPAANKYSVTLDLRGNTLEIGNYVGYEHVWIMGSAAPGGWSWDNITEMQRSSSNPNVFTYEGYLSEGELKFPLEIDHSFGGDFILAPQANCPISENGSYVIGNQPDNKWIISEAGNYRITIDVENETISFVKL